MKNYYSLLIVFLAFYSSIFPLIIEHNEFAHILHYLDASDYSPETLIIVDIDNTLAEPKGILGSEQWVNYYIDQKIKEGIAPQEARIMGQALFKELQYVIDLVPVEPGTPSLIKELQEKGIKVIALTGRFLEISDRTLEQLTHMDVNLTDNAWHEIMSPENPRYQFKNGVIFCCCGNKGKALKDVLEKLDYHPKKVIFIDDKKHYLTAVSEILDPEITFIGIRYSRCDEKILNFDGTLADQALLTFENNKGFYVSNQP